jgi:hypothetical protein
MFTRIDPVVSGSRGTRAGEYSCLPQLLTSSRSFLGSSAERRRGNRLSCGPAPRHRQGKLMGSAAEEPTVRRLPAGGSRIRTRDSNPRSPALTRILRNAGTDPTRRRGAETFAKNR